ncbi:hypothetical protein Ato02nite_040680 [Paractinoplanes toevensis]|uniref:Uncharacterized protein n=1 Tax=Paractinoplanes toevensis TaxID=571911 RepID=A0A919TD82_9ACTN|nr:hypothetical protein Ato02nite_040680 [Actinoplanes toevensis]
MRRNAFSRVTGPRPAVRVLTCVAGVGRASKAVLKLPPSGRATARPTVRYPRKAPSLRTGGARRGPPTGRLRLTVCA